MKRPIFFSENQFSSGNPHSNLSPRMSKIIIAAHTKDGAEMAEKYKLPKLLQNLMLEHHGTTLVSANIQSLNKKNTSTKMIQQKKNLGTLGQNHKQKNLEYYYLPIQPKPPYDQSINQPHQKSKI